MLYSWNPTVGGLLGFALSLTDMHLKSFCAFLWPDCSFLFSAAYYSIAWMDHSLFIHLPSEEHLGCLQVLAIMNKAAVNSCVQIFGGEYVFNSFE